MEHTTCLKTNNPALNIPRGFPVFTLTEVHKYCTIVAIPLPAEVTQKQEELLWDFGKFCYTQNYVENQLICVADNMAVPPALWLEIFSVFGEQEFVPKLL